MGKAWSDVAIRNLIDWSRCPVCDHRPLRDGRCPSCGADLTSPVALELAAASETAVEALKARQAVLDRLPFARGTAAAAQQVAPSAPPLVAPAEAGAAPRPSSQLSVQSVLAVAGAGLFAIAAIVFTFFNPDLTDETTRTAIVAGISLVFLGAAVLLARVGLQFSAEAVGALAMVFVALDVWAIATRTELGLNDYGNAAIATAVVSAIMIGLAAIRRLRTWLWSGAVGLTITPLLIGLAVDNQWSLAFGWLGLGAVALAAHELLHPLERRFASPLRADHGTATTAQLVGLVFVLALLFTLPAVDHASRPLGIAALLGALGVLAALATRNGLAALWSYLAGGLLTSAAAALPYAADFDDGEWLIALVPAAAFATATVIASVFIVAKRLPVRRGAVLAGALTVAFVTVAPAAVLALGQVVTVRFAIVEPLLGLVSVVGLVAATAALSLIAAGRRSSVLASLAVSFGVAALAGLATWGELAPLPQVVIALAAAVATAAAVTWIRPLAATRLRIRLPLLLGAHLLVLLAIAISWSDEPLTIFGGIAVVVATAALAFAVPRALQPVHVGLGFAYGLGVFAYTLSTQTALWDFPVLGLTTTLALVVALGATLLRVVPPRFWYAVLLVAGLPFLASVGATLGARSGWTGLAVGTAFVLVAILVVLHRTGLGAPLRSTAAALLLPTLSVVVIDVVPQLLPQPISASPIILPVIAGLVALTLPTTVFAGKGLLRLGHSAAEAKGVQLALEISALATGAIAAVLALARTAAGFDTTFLVLAIIGIGAAATGQFAGRRYAWYVAFISFTGALWSLLALNEVDSIEAFVLPPALLAAAIGLYAVGRGARALGWYAVGLAIAAFTSLAVLAVEGNPEGPVEWRAYALLAAAAMLIGAGWLLGRIREQSRFARLGRLRIATLWVAVAAASAGAVQAIRFGLAADVSAYGRTEAELVPVFAFSAAAAALAALAGWLLASRHAALAASRWLYVPALVFLVVGPIAAFRHGPAYPITMLVLTVAVLGLMIATVVRARTRAVTLPPVWLTFAVATAVAIAGWSEHSLFRVEAFSLTLGFFLLAAGVIAWRPVAGAVPSVNRWPIGYSGSWWLLAPGILVILGNSIMATGTDPRTERAILVIALALAAILIGNLRKLAAPFILGIVALPIENLIVFAVQIGDKIEPTTWWITLATAGAVLLVLAVSSERGTGGERGVGARLRDLR